jgi:hypothetical protein
MAGSGLAAGWTALVVRGIDHAELAAANAEAGGLYGDLREGFGRLPAFLYGWPVSGDCDRRSGPRLHKKSSGNHAGLFFSWSRPQARDS